MREDRVAQASIETIIIFSVSTLIVLILLNAGLNTQSSASDTLRISQARTTVDEVTSTAEEVWSQGPGASTTITIIVPDEVNDSFSGIISGRTINYRVLTRDGFADVSEVSNVNITGFLPTAGGQYDVTFTSRKNDVVISLVSSLIVSTDSDNYCEGDVVYYSVSAFNESGLPYETNVTTQLLDTSGVVRGEDNKTTINGIANGSFIIPSLGDYGWWKVYSFNNETSNFRNILVVNCNGSSTSNITITNCFANDTNLSVGESANLACWVSSSNPIDSVIYTIEGINYSAVADGQSWWNYTLTCVSPQVYDWTMAWANNSISQSVLTTSNGLPVSINCSSAQCVAGYYSWITNNESSFNEGSYVNTHWVPDHVELNNSHYGFYTSKVFDAGYTSMWNNLSWNSFMYGVDYGLSDIILMLHLEEGSSPFNDSSIYDNDAVCSGSSCPTSVAGHLGNGLSFDGVNDYLTISDSDSLDVNNMTISLWVKRTGDNSWNTLFEKRNQYRVRIDGDNKPIFYVGGFGEVYSNTSLPLNEWALVTVTFSDVGGGNNIARIYINGQLTGSNGPAWGSPSPNSNNLLIGKRSGNYFQGVIDEFRILNKTLSSDSIGMILNASYRVCDDSLCSGESWSNDYSDSPIIIGNSSRFFQYRFKFFSQNNSLSPELYNVTVNYYDYCYSGVIFDSCVNDSDCSSGYCRQDFVDDNDWYCVADSDDCTERGISRDNGFIDCVDSSTQIVCDNGVWINESSCNDYQGCDANSSKATYCGWQELTASCSIGVGCGSQSAGSCNDCGGFYEDSPFSSCSYSSGLVYCDIGCGAECDNSSDYYFNDAGDQCSYDCNNSCSFGSVDVCGDPGDLYGSTCFFGVNGCDLSGCTTSSEECPVFCINDFDGGSCSLTTRLNPSNDDYCYYNRQCLTSGCNLSSSDLLRADYCDYCSSSGAVSGDYSPSLNATCSSNCPDSGTRYWDETVSRSDDCDSNGNTQINTESYKKGYIYTSQTSAGVCDDSECASDCGGSGFCDSGVCTCAVLVNLTVFDEDFNPTPYYNYNWSRQGYDWDSKDNSRCHSSGGCAHADGWCSESSDWIVTNNNLINLSGSHNVYVDFWVREDTSFDPGDYLRVWCYDGNNWVKFYEEDCGDWTSTGTYHHRYANPNSSCWISDARFKVTIIANSNYEDVFIDDFRVKKEVLQ